MNDLIMLSAPVFMGLALGQAAYIHTGLGAIIRPEPITALEAPGLAVAETSGEGAALWAQAEKDAVKDKLVLARAALDAIPDVSCDAVAEAFGLPKLRVRRMSSKSRRKGKQVEEVGVYSHEQIWAAATGVTWN